MDKQTTEKNIYLAGVIGNQYHIVNRKLHNYWLSKYDINGLHTIFYCYRKASKLYKKLDRARHNGVNVIIPLKQTYYLYSITDRAALIGAANTVYFSKTEKFMLTTQMAMDLSKI